MKSTGIVRRIDDLGRVVIPKEIRRTLLLQEGDPLELFVEDGGIYLKKYVSDYDVVEMLEKVNRQFELMVEEIGHQHNNEIKQKIKEIKELLVEY